MSRFVVGVVALMTLWGCGGSSAAFAQVTVWTAPTAPVDDSRLATVLAGDGGDQLQVLSDVPVRNVGFLAGANLAFVIVTAKPGVGGINPRECMVVLAGPDLAEHYCDADGEFLPHQSAHGYLALPVGSDVTFVRLTICGQRFWEAPVNDFVVFPLTSTQSSSAWAAEVFRPKHPSAIEGSRRALTDHTCTPVS